MHKMKKSLRAAILIFFISITFLYPNFTYSYNISHLRVPMGIRDEIKEDIRKEWEQTQVAILTFNHGPATDPVSVLPSITGFLYLLLTEEFEAEDISKSLKDIYEKYSKSCDIHPLYNECRAHFRDTEPDFVLIAGWRKELSRLVEVAKEECTALQDVHRKYKEFCEINKMGEGKLKKINNYWEGLLKDSQKLVDILENRNRFARGALLKKKLNLAQIISKIRGENFDMVTELPEGVYIEGDELSLVNAIINPILDSISWSIKVRGSGAEVKLKVVKNGDLINFIISDNGPGIPEENLERIFELGFSTKEKGTGIGLAESKYIIEFHGGTIKVESKLGEGTIFTITLPVLKSPLTPLFQRGESCNI